MVRSQINARKLCSLLMAAVFILGAVGCARPVSSDVLQSDKPHDTSSEVSQTDLDSLSRGNSELAFDLYQVLAAADGNLFYFP